MWFRYTCLCIVILFNIPINFNWFHLISYLLFSPQHNVGGSASLGRDRACRHCWIPFFLTLLGKRPLLFIKKALYTIPEQMSKQKFDIQYLNNILKNHDFRDIGVTFVVVVFQWSLSNYKKTYQILSKKHFPNNHQQWPQMTSTTFPEHINFLNGRQT